MAWSDFLLELPYSTLFILLVNIVIVLAGSLVFRLIIDIDRLEAQELETHIYDQSLSDAKRRNDKKALRKLKRENIRMKRISASTSKQRLKASMTMIIPFAMSSILLNILYIGKDVIFFPFQFALFDKSTSFTVWYFLTYLTAYLPISKLFRTSPSFLGGFGNRVN